MDLLGFVLSPSSGYYDAPLGVRFDNHTNKPSVDDAFTLSSRIGGDLSEAEEAERDAQDDLGFKDRAGAFKAYRANGKKQRNTDITENFARAFKTQKVDFMAEIETEAGADIRSIWTPTAENCFKRLNAKQLETLFIFLLDLKPDAVALKPFAKMKKGEKVDIMHTLFNDPEDRKLRKLTKEQEAKIAAWVPACFN